MYEAIKMNEAGWLFSGMNIDSCGYRTLFKGRCMCLIKKKLNLVEKYNQYKI
jgi:hypothetical protein